MAEYLSTATSVLKTSTTSTAEGTAGGTIVAGQAIYIDTAAAGVLKVCDADAATSAECAGIALNGGGTGQPIRYATGGDITLSTMTVGAVFMVSQTTAGSFCADSDLLTGDFISIIGVATTATNLRIKINNSGVARP